MHYCIYLWLHTQHGMKICGSWKLAMGLSNVYIFYQLIWAYRKSYTIILNIELTVLFINVFSYIFTYWITFYVRGLSSKGLHQIFLGLFHLLNLTFATGYTFSVQCIFTIGNMCFSNKGEKNHKLKQKCRLNELLAATFTCTAVNTV